MMVSSNSCQVSSASVLSWCWCLSLSCGWGFPEVDSLRVPLVRTPVISWFLLLQCPGQDLWTEEPRTHHSISLRSHSLGGVSLLHLSCLLVSLGPFRTNFLFKFCVNMPLLLQMVASVQWVSFILRWWHFLLFVLWGFQLCQAQWVRKGQRQPWTRSTCECRGPGVSNLLASLGHTGRRRAVLGYPLSTQTLTKTDEQKKEVLIKFMILCWAAFIAILHCMWPEGHGLDTLGWA